MSFGIDCNKIVSMLLHDREGQWIQHRETKWLILFVFIYLFQYRLDLSGGSCCFWYRTNDGTRGNGSPCVPSNRNQLQPWRRHSQAQPSWRHLQIVSVKPHNWCLSGSILSQREFASKFGHFRFSTLACNPLQLQQAEVRRRHSICWMWACPFSWNLLGLGPISNLQLSFHFTLEWIACFVFIVVSHIHQAATCLIMLL